MSIAIYYLENRSFWNTLLYVMVFDGKAIGRWDELSEILGFHDMISDPTVKEWFIFLCPHE